MLNDDLIKKLEEQNETYWRVRNRVKAEQQRLRKFKK